MRSKAVLAVLAMALAQGVALAAVGDAAQADAARKKPLQRCDQLKAEAEIECLKKARERISETRKQREAKGEAKEAAKK